MTLKLDDILIFNFFKTITKRRMLLYATIGSKKTDKKSMYPFSDSDISFLAKSNRVSKKLFRKSLTDLANIGLINPDPTHEGRYAPVGLSDKGQRIWSQISSYSYPEMKIFFPKTFTSLAVLDFCPQNVFFFDELLANVNNNYLASWIRAQVRSLSKKGYLTVLPKSLNESRWKLSNKGIIVKQVWTNLKKVINNSNETIDNYIDWQLIHLWNFPMKTLYQQLIIAYLLFVKDYTSTSIIGLASELYLLPTSLKNYLRVMEGMKVVKILSKKDKFVNVTNKGENYLESLTELQKMMVEKTNE